MKLPKNLLVFLCIVFSLTKGFAQDTTPVKVGFVFLHKVDESVWGAAHAQARDRLKSEFGAQIEIVSLENVAEGAAAEEAIRGLAEQGMDLIFTTSFEFMDETLKVAKEFPNVKFENATGYKTTRNLATYNARFYEGRYLEGIIAGALTKTNEIGYIASVPVPEVMMSINAAYLGAKSVNPDVNINVVWVNSWFDPDEEAEAAEDLIEDDVDILFQHTDSFAPMRVAQDEGIFAFGQSIDMNAILGTDAQLTAVLDNWSPHYIQSVRALIDGKWETGTPWFGFDEGWLSMAPYHAKIPQNIVNHIEERRQQMRAKTFNPFTGPLNEQDGTPWLAEDQKAKEDKLWGMDFFVEGISARLPR